MNFNFLRFSPIKSIIFFLAVLFLFGFDSYSQINKAKDLIQSNDSVKICFISDTQEPNFFEKLFLKYNHNQSARQLLFEGILNYSPDAVFHLGDIVEWGFNNDNWKTIDEFVEKLEKRRIPFYPIPGNHEYIIFAKAGIKNFEKRYPYAPISGYYKKINNIVVVLFNSNFDQFNKEENEKHLEWYKQTIFKLDADSTVDFIIVGCHHSPFTNSKIVSPNNIVQENYLPVFYKSKKCRLFISGHAHTYEHFRIQNKDFLVIGGGGGIQQTLLTGKDEKYKDLFDQNSETRMFHFLELVETNNKIEIVVRMVDKNFSKLYTADKLEFDLHDGNFLLRNSLGSK